MRAPKSEGALDSGAAGSPGSGGSAGDAGSRWQALAVYVGVGLFLGLIFIKSEVASWFRIQEMFRFQAFHMYGVIGCAVAVAALGIALMKRRGATTVNGQPIQFPERDSTPVEVQHVIGGIAFGLGWGLLGACPGPIFALVGAGLLVMGVALLAALAGAWTYGFLKPRLPHG